MSDAPARWNAGQQDPIEWIEHDGVRYGFPAPQAVTVSMEQRTGDWRKVLDTPSTPKESVSKQVFALWLDHRVAPKAATYAYSIVPSSKAADAQLQILSNTAQLQAVKVGANWLGAALWSAGAATLDGQAIEVDQPCLIMMENTSDGRRVTVADPTQQLESLKLKIGDLARTIELPRAGDAGKSVSVLFPAAAK
jgi:chondroitin AC lyase